jgi:hypothetical protein
MNRGKLLHVTVTVTKVRTAAEIQDPSAWLVQFAPQPVQVAETGDPGQGPRPGGDRGRYFEAALNRPGLARPVPEEDAVFKSPGAYDALPCGVTARAASALVYWTARSRAAESSGRSFNCLAWNGGLCTSCRASR